MYCAYIYSLKIAIFGKNFYSGYLAKSSLVVFPAVVFSEKDRTVTERPLESEMYDPE
jgi:hypothetical protein